MPSAPDLNTMLDHVPTVGVWALIAMVVLGLALWLLGRKLARPGCAVAGLAVGMFVGLVVADALDAHQSLPIYLVAGGIIGGVLAALLFRVWMGASLALFLALAAPAASLVLRGAPPPAAPTDIQQLMIDTTRPGTAQRSPQDLWLIIRSIYQQQTQHIANWWRELGSTGWTIVIVAATIGAAVGLLLGLLRPYAAASVQSALVGGALWLAGLRGLMAVYAPDQTAWAPTSPRAWLVVLGLITAAGVLLQWTLWRRRADQP
ncbi:MAG: hypothetical protein WD042_17210 [Phycisphaeraceae bacterium]